MMEVPGATPRAAGAIGAVLEHAREGVVVRGVGRRLRHGGPPLCGPLSASGAGRRSETRLLSLGDGWARLPGSTCRGWHEWRGTLDASGLSNDPDVREFEIDRLRVIFESAQISNQSSVVVLSHEIALLDYRTESFDGEAIETAIHTAVMVHADHGPGLEPGRSEGTEHGNQLTADPGVRKGPVPHVVHQMHAWIRRVAGGDGGTGFEGHRIHAWPSDGRHPADHGCWVGVVSQQVTSKNKIERGIRVGDPGSVPLLKVDS